ncbi:hypothetical protein BGZ80_003979 [Entomortierella chlamydospora]|uniref:Uncharacterized protein n=1 Tax=Entomortierella chlamydospora TaxID=101097 RepID=A0A9P6N0H1_9FUNG|nr:hypothetical protein BGZ79_004150 [Entomortierella chlamydospora]KAG0020555.1 hypothetical protein BGZ80_003979 [Entomortierella chlamydospora]
MSFIYNYFTNGNATPAELENTAALKAMIKDRKSVLKTEHKQCEGEYKQAVKDAEAEYERSKRQAKENMYRNILHAAQTEVDAIMATDVFANSDAKTRAKIEGFRAWMTTASTSCIGEEPLPSYPVEKKPELIAA